MSVQPTPRSGISNSRFNQWFSAISATSFTFFMLLLTAYCVLVNDQIGDIILQANELDPSLHGVGFVLALFWLSLVCWWSARFIFDQTARYYSGRSRDSMEVGRWGIKSAPEPGSLTSETVAAWLPRLYAAVPPLIVLISGLDKRLWFVSISAAVVLVLVLVTLVFRFRLLSALQNWAHHSKQRKHIVGRLSERLSRQSFWMWLTLVPYVLVTIVAIADPFLLGHSMGAFFVVFWGLGSVLLFLTLAVYFCYYLINKKGHKFSQYLSFKPPYPVFLSVLVYTALIAMLFDTDNHHVRRLPAGQPGYAFVNLDQAWQVFSDQLPVLVPEDDDAGFRIPVFFVASQGGGLRAAYWTASILSELEQKFPGFSRHIFSLAGVSGGSVGNVFYAAALDANHKSNADIGQLTEAVGKDYLSPVTTSFLFNDLLYRFVPFSFSERFKRDRAEVLETSWQMGFTETFGQSQMSMPLQELYHQREHWLPLLMSLGAHQEQGARLITAPFAIEPQIFTDKYDTYRLMGCNHNGGLNCDMRLSTVALNAARFPFVTPSGTLNSPDSEVDWSKKQHIIDGGYVENFGNMTSLDMIHYLQRHNKLKVGENIELVPILLLIANDQAINARLFDTNRTEPYAAGGSWMMNEITNPIQGLVSNRSGNTVRNLASMLNHQAQSAGDTPMLKQQIGDVSVNNSLIFNLPKDLQNQHRVPLGWWLSMDSRNYMQQQFEPGRQGAALVQAAGCLLGGVRKTETCTVSEGD